MKGTSVVFPAYCPHCLRPAAFLISIQSADKMTGYYIFYSRWKHSIIQVPFCAEFARRRRALITLWVSILLVVIAILVAFVVVSGIVLQGWQIGLWVVGFVAITSIPSLVVRPGKYIELLAESDNCIEFSVRDPEYAKMLASLNEVISQTEEERTH